MSEGRIVAYGEVRFENGKAVMVTGQLATYLNAKEQQKLLDEAQKDYDREIGAE